LDADDASRGAQQTGPTWARGPGAPEYAPGAAGPSSEGQRARALPVHSGTARAPPKPTSSARAKAACARDLGVKNRRAHGQVPGVAGERAPHAAPERRAVAITIAITARNVIYVNHSETTLGPECGFKPRFAGSVQKWFLTKPMLDCF